MSFPKKTLIAGILLGILFFISPHVFSQDRTKFAQVSRTDTPPRIDGLTDDACWKGVKPVTGFFQFDPVNGAKASEETLVWMLYDQKNIYFAFLMQDSQPDKIWAELTPRNAFQNNDSITVILDTYNDKRTSIRFTVNPRGVQKNSVETIWKSGATVREDGWTAEMAIPFKSLRFSSEDIQTWGINFERYIFRLNEQDYWTCQARIQPGIFSLCRGQNLPVGRGEGRQTGCGAGCQIRHTPQSDPRCYSQSGLQRSGIRSFYLPANALRKLFPREPAFFQRGRPVFRAVHRG